ncbi:expressed unknown protein [Seminavis robusta]|uniref:Uncharacterized protein n=1 Tax=Seminavis robusta TaxID=568900 RepID=A0A9N8E7V2_9STRA|nr:expressed unknown protein [Seminavis robusta]|eukprot:Sro716_g191890.1 n/a (377) ;mRNA; r:25883-27013
MPTNNNKKKREKKNKSKWPWEPEEEALWGHEILAAYGAISELDRKVHKTIVTGIPDPTISAEDIALGTRRRTGAELPPSESATPRIPVPTTNTKVDGKTSRENSVDNQKSQFSPTIVNGGSIQEKRRAALRESRETEVDLTHKQRLDELQSKDPDLWAEIDIKKFRKLVHKDNQHLRDTQLPPGTFRVPVKPYPGCPYPCQLCGTPLRAGVYTEDNICFCRPDGDYESKSLQWALDSDLYERAYQEKRSMLIACTNCSLPKPWGGGPPITSSSLSSDYKNIDAVANVQYPGYNMDPASLGPLYAQMIAAMGGMDLHDQAEMDEERAWMHDDRNTNHGFTEDETYELLCQGVKPWDDDARDVLAALNGAYDHYDDYY